MSTSVVTADKLGLLLNTRHSGDLIVHECKTGPSQMVRGCPRLDTWVLKRSYTRPCMTGYEIKVNRSDFTRDKKWMDYLDYCNEFYFVCPPGLIAPDEVGSE